MKDCIFCNIPADKKILSNRDCFAMYDEYPVSPGHMLVIPNKHIQDYRDLDNQYKNILWDMVDNVIKHLTEKYHPNGFNIGINCGIDAGQSIQHVHIHIIPRYKGDVKNPRGGVRGVIPCKQNY